MVPLSVGVVIDSTGDLLRVLALGVIGVHIGMLASIWFLYWRLSKRQQTPWARVRYVSAMSGAGLAMSAAAWIAVLSRIVYEASPITAGIVAILIGWTLGCASLAPVLRDLRHHWQKQAHLERGESA